MKIQIKVKPAYEKQKVAFNNSGAPLGKRDDLALLLINAHKGNDKFILNMFDNPPSLEELQKEVTDGKMASIENQSQPTGLQTVPPPVEDPTKKK